MFKILLNNSTKKLILTVKEMSFQEFRRHQLTTVNPSLIFIKEKAKECSGSAKEIKKAMSLVCTRNQLIKMALKE